MFHIVYVSTATRPFTDADAVEVLDDAQAFNSSQGVTGLLVHALEGADPAAPYGTFLQVLEGDAEAVEAAYQRAAASTRQASVLRTPAIEVPERVFPDWAMGFERALPGQLVEHVLTPLVHHQLLTGSHVRAVLLERWGSLLAVA